MKLTLKNYELVPSINFLQSLELKASTDSRHRTKLVKLLLEAHEGLVESQYELVEKYGERDQNGELIYAEDGTNYLINQYSNVEYSNENKNLLNEEVTIAGGIYEKNIKELERVLNEYDGILAGEEAIIYDRLLDEFEKNNEAI